MRTGNALRQTHPIECRIDVGEEIAVQAALAVGDAHGDALDPAEHRPRLSHQQHFGAISDMHAIELGFLEIAVDMQGIRVDERHQRLAGHRVIARPQLHVGHGAVDRGDDGGALQIEARQVPAGDRLGDGRRQLLDARRALLRAFLGDERTQLEIAVSLAHGFVEQGFLRLEFGLGLRQCEFVARAVDDEQQLPAPHPLIVAHRNLGDEARNIGDDLDDVGAHAPVARPGRLDVIGPQTPADERGESDDRERRRHAAQPDQHTLQGRPQCATTATPPRQMTKPHNSRIGGCQNSRSIRSATMTRLSSACTNQRDDRIDEEFRREHAKNVDFSGHGARSAGDAATGRAKSGAFGARACRMPTSACRQVKSSGPPPRRSARAAIALSMDGAHGHVGFIELRGSAAR